MQSLTNNYTQLVTLPNLRIIDYVLGPPGSVHNSMAFKESHVWKESDQLFHDGEWLWADSAYGLTPWCVVLYKKPQSLLPANCQFNYHLSMVCTLCYPSAKGILLKIRWVRYGYAVGRILVHCKTCLQVPDSRVQVWSQQSYLRRDKIQYFGKVLQNSLLTSHKMQLNRAILTMILPCQ